MFVFVSTDDTEKTTSPVRLLGEWPISGDNNQWIASLNCPIYLAENYTPEDDEMGFHIYLTLEDQATNVESV